MESITLEDGRTINFPTSENESYKFYSCMTFDDAAMLSRTLTDLGNKCEVDDNSRGWFVRVEK